MAKEVKIQVRFNDLDGYGHVNNSAYLTYFEVARTEAYFDIFNRSIEKKMWFILTHSEVNYKKFIKLEDPVIVKLSIVEAKGALFTFQYEVHDGMGTVYATGKTVHVVYDAVQNKPIRVPDNIKEEVDK